MALKEIRLSMLGVTSENDALKVGKMLNVTHILYINNIWSIKNDKFDCMLTYRLIKVELGKVIAISTIQSGPL